MRQYPGTRPETRERLLAKAYLIAKSVVIKAGYSSEVEWQYRVSLADISEPILLREAAWVILCCGMRELIIRQKFSGISRAFLQWKSAKIIIEHAEMCKADGLTHINHIGKMDAIIDVASHVNQYGFEEVSNKIREHGVDYLKQFPYIGPVTSFHLGKNLGLPLAKPDRHLFRIAQRLGYDSVQKLCVDIADMTGEPIPVVDLVLWRYSTLYHRNVIRFLRLLDSSRCASSVQHGPHQST